MVSYVYSHMDITVGFMTLNIPLFIVITELSWVYWVYKSKKGIDNER